jgi:TonB family protein
MTTIRFCTSAKMSLRPGCCTKWIRFIREKRKTTGFRALRSIYSIVVDKSGKVRNIELLSPIGYGLDETGTEAIRKWVFAPAMKDGAPVSVFAQVEVNFRFPGVAFDAKSEERRTTYNAAVHNLQSPDKKQKAVERSISLLRISILRACLCRGSG